MLKKIESRFWLNEGLYFWLEQNSSVMFRSFTENFQPIRITREEAREIANELIKMADAIEADSAL